MKVSTHKKYNGRENLLIELTDFEPLPKSFNLPDPYFHVIIFADHEDIPNNDPLFDFLDSLLERGGVYFVCGGTAGGKVHDCVDELIVIDEVEKTMKYPLQPGKTSIQENDVVLTTAHAHESVEETVWYALNVAYSPDVCMKENPANIFFLRQGSPYLEQVKKYLEDPSDIDPD